jgi:hypothetical protein
MQTKLKIYEDEQAKEKPKRSYNRKEIPLNKIDYLTMFQITGKVQKINLTPPYFPNISEREVEIGAVRKRLDERKKP